MVFNKYKRAEGYELKEQPAGGGGKRPATNWIQGKEGREGGAAWSHRQARNNTAHVLTNNMGKDHRRYQSVCRKSTWEGEEARMRTENNFHRLR